MNYNYQIVFWGKFSALKKRKLITLKCRFMGFCGRTGTLIRRKDVSPQVTFLPATFLPATFLPKNHFSPLFSKICTGATFLPKRRFSPRHFSPLSNFHAVTSKIRKWGEMSQGETSFGEKRRTCANFGKKWGEMDGIPSRLCL